MLTEEVIKAQGMKMDNIRPKTYTNNTKFKKNVGQRRGLISVKVKIDYFPI